MSSRAAAARGLRGAAEAAGGARGPFARRAAKTLHGRRATCATSPPASWSSPAYPHSAAAARAYGGRGALSPAAADDASAKPRSRRSGGQLGTHCAWGLRELRGETAAQRGMARGMSRH